MPQCPQINNGVLFPSLGLEMFIYSLVLTCSLTNSDQLELNAVWHMCHPPYVVQVWKVKNQSQRETLLHPIE